MPYSRPTITALRQMAQNDVTVGLGNFGVVSLLSKSVLRVMSWVQAGLAYLQYGYIDYVYMQSNPYTATEEALDGWAALKGVVREDATAASSVFVSIGNVVGTPLPSGALINRADGFQYASAAVYTVDATGTLTVPCTATVAGSLGNAPQGTPLTLATPVDGINSAGSFATAPATGGTDQELDPSLRTRMLQAFSAPAQGGDASDYVTWALDVPGVTRAWSIPNGLGAGTVVVYTMFDEAEAAFGGFPQGTNGVATAEPRDIAATGDQLTVANALFPLRPATALVYSYAPAQFAAPVAISDLSPNTSPIQAAITAAITDAYVRLGNATGSTIEPSDLYAAVQSVPGISTFAIASPTVAVVVPPGSLPVVPAAGGVTFASPGS